MATTVADCGATTEDAGSAACVVIAPAPPAVVVETAPFTIVLVFTGASSTDFELDAGTPEVASPPGGEELPFTLAEVSMVSPGTAADEPQTEELDSRLKKKKIVSPGT